MNGFLWAAGHLGWGIFALVAFTGLWWLLTDLVWRLKAIRLARLAAGMIAGWITGLVLILVIFYFFGR